jgi:hypothetical protein
MKSDPFDAPEGIVQTPGTAVEGLTPMQISGFDPRVPRIYRYSE